MDRYAPLLLDNGLLGMIGKGERSSEVIESIKKNKAVYFGATGGAGALIAQCVKSAEIVAFDELGTEAVRKLYVENMPVVVLIDSNGNNAYSIGRAKFATMNP
jgi:fumarate hydratase subunit beta